MEVNTTNKSYQCHAEKCPVCNGFTTVNYGKTKCQACKGQGYVIVPNTIEEERRRERTIVENPFK